MFGRFFPVDPFSDASKGVDEASKQEQPIHIRIQQRNGRKTLTTVQGIADNYDKKKLVKAFKKVCQMKSNVTSGCSRPIPVYVSYDLTLQGGCDVFSSSTPPV